MEKLTGQKLVLKNWALEKKLINTLLAKLTKKTGLSAATAVLKNAVSSIVYLTSQNLTSLSVINYFIVKVIAKAISRRGTYL